MINATHLLELLREERNRVKITDTTFLEPFLNFLDHLVRLIDARKNFLRSDDTMALAVQVPEELGESGLYLSTKPAKTINQPCTRATT